METIGDLFSVVEYLSIFTAFIYGYVATRFFFGWSAMINFRHSIKFSKEHLFWTILTFGLLIDIWWGSWIKCRYIGEYTTLYLVSLLPPLIFYLISVLLFPPLSDEKFLDLKSYFNRIRKRNYLIFIVLFLSFELGRYFFKREIHIETYFNISAIGFAVAGYFTKSSRLNYFILSMGCAMLIVHIVFQPPLQIQYPIIDGFSVAEYLTTFSAFIYGSIASRFFSGWGTMISKFDRIIFSRDHLVWTFLIFALLMDFWIGSWDRIKYVVSGIDYFILSLLVPLAFYALAAVIFPIVRNGQQIDLRSFFQRNKKSIYLLFGLTMLANGITANVMEQELVDIENVYRVAALLLTALAFFATREILERGVLAIGCVVLLIHSVL